MKKQYYIFKLLAALALLIVFGGCTNSNSGLESDSELGLKEECIILVGEVTYSDCANELIELRLDEKSADVAHSLKLLFDCSLTSLFKNDEPCIGQTIAVSCIPCSLEESSDPKLVLGAEPIDSQETL